MKLNKPKIINNFHNKDYVLSSSDLLAVKHGVKKATRIECSTLNEFKQIQNDFKKHSLVTVVSDKKLFGKYNVYVSKNKKYASDAKNVDPSYKIIDQKMSFNDSLEYVRKFSELLSYPKCCYENYIDNVLKNINIREAKVFIELPVKINFTFNNCLNGLSNLYFSFHLPCSFDCKNSVEHGNKIRGVIGEESPEFFRMLEYYLKRPYLIFLDCTLGNMYVSWDNRSGFFFEGKVIKNKLFYSNFYYFKTNYPDYENKNRKNKARTIAKYLDKGDVISFSGDDFKISKGKKTIYHFENNKILVSKLLNFV